MYSIHNIVKYEAPSQLAEEQPADMMCMFDGIPYLDNLPKYDQYDDDQEDEIDFDCSKQLATCCWQEKYHLQFRYDNQPLHNSHDHDEEEAENFRVGKNLCPYISLLFNFWEEIVSKLSIVERENFLIN